MWLDRRGGPQCERPDRVENVCASLSHIAFQIRQFFCPAFTFENRNNMAHLIVYTRHECLYHSTTEGHTAGQLDTDQDVFHLRPALTFCSPAIFEHSPDLITDAKVQQIRGFRGPYSSQNLGHHFRPLLIAKQCCPSNYL